MSPVCAVLVTYHCGPGISALLSSLLTQLQAIVLVDNGSGNDTIAALEQSVAQYPGRLTLVRNTENIGLAAAQNQGIRQALANGFEWVIFLDDDSQPGTAMVETMLTAWQQENNPAIGIIAPRFVEQNISTPPRYLTSFGKIGFLRKALKSGETLHDAAIVISSGSLVHKNVFQAIGLMTPELFIDYVDYEFCLRARQHGFGIVVVGDAVLHHRQGNKERRELLGMPVVTTNYSARRRYTAFRNRTFILRRFTPHFPFLLPYEGMAYVWDVARILCFESEKGPKLAAALRGLKDGLIRPVPLEERL